MLKMDDRDIKLSWKRGRSPWTTTDFVYPWLSRFSRAYVAYHIIF